MSKTKDYNVTDGFRQQSRELASVLPLPSVLESYAEIDPKFIPELIEMVKKEQQHRHAMERKIIRTQAYTARIGQLLSFALVIIIGYIAIAFVADGLLFLSGLTIVSGFSFLFAVNMLARSVSRAESVSKNIQGKQMQKKGNISPGNFKKRPRYRGRRSGNRPR